MSLKENKCLLLPGPVFIPHRVLQAMSRQMVNRRGADFQNLLVEVIENLKGVFQTKGDVLLFPGSGTGGLEIAVANALSPGDHVLCLTAGVFSERFATIAERMGMRVRKLGFPLHEGIDPGRVAEVLQADKEKNIKAVLVTHNETATGVVNDIETIGKIAQEHGALLFVDAVSSLGGIDLRTDEWHLDIVAGVAHKGLFSAPGLAMVSVSKKAWRAIDRSTTPRYFFDLRRAKEFYEKKLTPYTYPTSTLYALREALRMGKEEGLENVLARHEVITKALRAGIRAIGLELFVSDERASKTVTAVKVPPGVDSVAMRKTMSEKYHVYIAGGLGELDKSTFRIGHLGYIGRGEILNGISALELALREQGYEVPCGKGVAAAQEVFARSAGLI